jgi:hypothetical protein
MGHWFKGKARRERRAGSTPSIPAPSRKNRQRNALRSDKATREHRAGPSRRELRLEQFESRMLLTSGPTLISIIPNDGSVWQPGQNITTHNDPTQLTFRFLLSAGETLDPTTLGGIQITRSGGDGVFDANDRTAGYTGNDVTVTPGFIGIDPAQPNQVDMRFSAPLPDDLYQITVVGGASAGAFKDTAGVSFNSQNPTSANYTQNFRLQLGPQVLSVVPQPVTRNASGSLVANNNEVDVYFNEPVQTLPGDATHLDPSQFELISTNNSASTNDDVVFIADPKATTIPAGPSADGFWHVPGSVIYNAANNEARIVFQNAGGPITVNQLAAAAGVTGSDAFRLRVGNNTLPLPAPVSPPAQGLISQFTST